MSEPTVDEMLAACRAAAPTLDWAPVGGRDDWSPQHGIAALVPGADVWVQWRWEAMIHHGIYVGVIGNGGWGGRASSVVDALREAAQKMTAYDGEGSYYWRPVGQALLRLLVKPKDASPPLYLREVRPEHRGGRGRFWRHNAAGYTNDIREAGVYVDASEDETWRSVPLAEYRDELASELAPAVRLFVLAGGDVASLPPLADREVTIG